jgi:hypothetical protein
MKMNANAWIRQFHRWISILFTLNVAGIFALLGAGTEPAQWVYLTPLPWLFALLLTGLWLFALPYVARRRAAQN